MRKGSTVTEETRERMRQGQRRRMVEGRHNFPNGHLVPEEWRDVQRQRLAGSVHSAETKQKMSMAHLGRKYKPMSLETRKNMSRARLGRKDSKEVIDKRRASRAGYRHSDETRRKMSIAQKSRDVHPRWKGGKLSPDEKARKTVEYKIWRDAVYRRDDFTCQECGKRGGRLNADHIKPFALFPELRLAIDNGRTLCVKCHHKTETYGGKILRFRRVA